MSLPNFLLFLREFQNSGKKRKSHMPARVTALKKPWIRMTDSPSQNSFCINM